MLTIGCQSLLNMGVAHHGWLRRKGTIHSLADKLRLGSWATCLFHWEMCYVVLHNGCLYVYKDEKQTKPDKALSLFGYTQVLRAGELRQKDVAWPFKIVYILDTDAKVHYFGADVEDDMKKWMIHVKKEMILANDIRCTDDSLSTDDYDDLETPVSTRNYFRAIQNLNEIQNTLGSDSDLEEYTYPRESRLVNDFSDGETAPSSPTQPVPSPRRPLPPTPPSNHFRSPRPTTEQQPSKPTAEHQQPPPAAKTKPAVARKPQLPVTKGTSDTGSSPAHLRPSAASRTPQTQPGYKPTNGLSSSHCNDTKPAELSESLTIDSQSPALPPRTHEPVNHTDIHTRRPPVPLPLDVEPRADSTASPPAPPERLRHHQLTHAAVNQVKGQQSLSVGDLEAAAMWSCDPGEGNRLMMQLADEGTYMIRPSVDACSKTLLVVAEFQLRKYKIHVNEDHNYSLQTHFTHVFDSVHQLISFYKDNNLPNRSTKLSKPYSELM